MNKQFSRKPPEPHGGRGIAISVIVPLFNEEESIDLLHHSVVESLEPLRERFEILFVDDGSTDGTAKRARRIAARDPRVCALLMRRNYGQTAAMSAGIEFARGDYLVTMDGDLQNDAADIPMMLEKAKAGYDLVVGWRMNRQDKWLSRKLPSKLANWLIGKITRLPIRDNGCSLKVYRAEIIKHVPLYSDMHRFIPAMTIPFGTRIAEVGVRHHGRRFGKSKYGLSRVAKVLLDLMAIKTILVFARRPLAAFSSLACLCLMSAAVSAVVLENLAGSLVVEMAVLGLLVSLAVFLFLLGLIAAVVFETQGASRADPSAPPVRLAGGLQAQG